MLNIYTGLWMVETIDDANLNMKTSINIMNENGRKLF